MEWDIKVRAAQRGYTCSECGKEISKGEIYVFEIIHPMVKPYQPRHYHRSCFNRLPCPRVFELARPGQES